MTDTPVVYTDDDDAHVDWPVTDTNGGDLTFTPLAAVGSGAYDITATWLGDPGVNRTLRVPLVGLTPGRYTVYLKVPGGSDVRLGAVQVSQRA